MVKVVEIKNLVKSYGGKDYQTKVLKNINLDIYENDFIAIMGPSGAGKSTLLNMLSTLDKPTQGQIFIDGEDITKVNNKRLSKIRQEKIGFIFQDYNLLDNMTLQDNIALPLSLNGIKSDEVIERTKQIAALFKLSNHLKKYPYQLSGGQKQRGASYAKQVYMLSDGQIKCRLNHSGSRQKFYDEILSLLVSMGSEQI